MLDSWRRQKSGGAGFDGDVYDVGWSVSTLECQGMAGESARVAGYNFQFDPILIVRDEASPHVTADQGALGSGWCGEPND
jgi:hypothetical protein